MKIAVVIKECIFAKGGAERYAARLMQHLAASTNDVHLFSYSWDEKIADKVQCHFVPYKRKPLSLKARSFAKNVKKQLARYNFDLILGLTQFVPQHIYRTGGGIYASYLEKIYPNEKMRCWKSWLFKSRFMLQLEKKIVRSPETLYFMANSHMCREELIQYHQVHPDKIEVIYNGVNPLYFDDTQKQKNRKEIRKQFDIHPEQIVLLFVGNGFRRKNLDTFLQMAKELKVKQGCFKFVVIGQGKIGRYRRKATELGVESSCLFLGAQSDVQKWYHAADLFVHPALYDPCSNATLEALASGLPVLTSVANGASYWVKNGLNGFVIEDPRDAKSFAEKALFFLNVTEREKMKLYAPESVQLLTEQNHYQALQHLLEKVDLIKRKKEKIKVEPAFFYGKK